MTRAPRVVALGGGHGLAASLSALRHVTDHLTAVVTVADNGGSSGRLRRELGVLPPGDLRMALAALCRDDEWGRTWADVLQHRFNSDGELHDHSVGNLLIVALWELLGDIRAGADLVIDTSNMNIHQLAAKIVNAFGDEENAELRATVVSFGFKYGIPVDADVVADMRFIPNPYWQPDLRPMTGQDKPVSDFVLGHPLAQQFLQNYVDVLDTLRTGYLNEGKRFVTVAIGCTGGKHRSVAMAEEIARRLREKGSPTLVVHRDLGRE